MTKIFLTTHQNSQSQKNEKKSYIFKQKTNKILISIINKATAKYNKVNKSIFKIIKETFKKNLKEGKLKRSRRSQILEGGTTNNVLDYLYNFRTSG
jgi:hypothetical protein